MTIQKKKYIKLILFTIISSILLSGCSTFFLNESDQFIKVNENKFYLDGKPYYFIGTNFWYGCYLGSSGETGDKERLVKELDVMKSYGITNLRILAASEKSAINNTLVPAIQEEPGIFNENLLEGLDFLLSEMGKRDMHAVVFLNNYWEWSGGMAQYNAWFSETEIVNPYDTTQGWGEFMKYSAEFYKNENANEYFREYIKMIVTRKNMFNDLYYYKDPAIMSWQLANEPRPWGTADDVEYYNAWINTTAEFIHSIDPNHLVSTGSEGTIGSLGSDAYFINAHRTRNIDYLTFHLWVKNWNWFDARNSIETYPAAELKAREYINQHIELARLLNKPIVLEEFGIPRDNEVYHPDSSIIIRDKFYNTIFEIVTDSALAGSPLSGANFWAWAGSGRTSNKDYYWRSGDPFTGDPPHEPQGLYSIFDSDTSTMNIIKLYADKLNPLSESKQQGK